jgi:cell division transport system permease protein
MSGSSDRPGVPPLRPSLQRALQQQRLRAGQMSHEAYPANPPQDSYYQPVPDQPATGGADYDPYGYDQFPDTFDAGEQSNAAYAEPYGHDLGEPRTGAPGREPASTRSNQQHSIVASHPIPSLEASRPSGPRPGPSSARSPEPPRGDASNYDAPRTGVERGTASLPPQTLNELSSGDEMYAPTRRGAKRRQSGAPIVPAGSVTGRSLTLVISIMCFLACLTAGAVYMMNQSAAAWMRDIASEVTVQIEAKDKTDPEKQLRDVSQFLARQPGVRNVRPLSVADSAQLLEPWLGQSDALKSLPIPRLIALEVDRLQPPDLIQMRAQLSAQFKGVSLDDHRHWQQQIRTVTRSFALGGLAILMLVGAATTAIIVSATRSALAANREIVEVLHFVGATDKFIAREFEKHFLSLGIRAGLVGALSAMLVFAALPLVMELLGGGSVTVAEINRMIGSGTLDAAGYILLGIVVVVISSLCMLTSRIGVYGILHTQR